ncbi:MAG: PAS domain-containing protein [Acidobacteriota bacterium]
MFARLADRLRPFATLQAYPEAAGWMTRLLSPPTVEEGDRRRAHLAALIVVAVAATLKDVIGLTGGSATYMMYVLAIAISALGGFTPGCVATLAAVLLLSAAGHPALSFGGRLMFVLEGVGVSALVAAVSHRVGTAEARVAELQTVNGDLRGQARRGVLTLHALQHLEDIADDAAVFLVSAQGLIVEWPASAERMYGYTDAQIVGASIAAIFSDAGAVPDIQALLEAGTSAGPARRAGAHRRSDGTRVNVEFEVRPCRLPFSGLFTVAVHDMSRRRESDAFREAALSAQAALQKALDEAHGQLSVLEWLTDPAVSPAGGAAAIGELLERLRVSVRADGVALVQFGLTRARLIAGAGLRPAHVGAPGVAANSAAADGRVALVHNDAVRVTQVSALTWSPKVSSIIVVPVCHIGSAAFRIEMVNERRSPATEFDLAIARIVADRLAQTLALQVPADSSNAVA